jgi:hypothetical protein
VAGVPGAYVVGWFKRGSSGGIGDNRADAEDTVRTLLQDAAAGRLPGAPRGSRAFLRALRRRTPDLVGLGRILAAERSEGQRVGRSAAKLAPCPSGSGPPAAESGRPSRQLSRFTTESSTPSPALVALPSERPTRIPSQLTGSKLRA